MRHFHFSEYNEDYAYDYQLLQWYRGSDIRENGAEKNSAPSVQNEAVNPYPDEYMYLRHPLKLRNYVDKMVSVTNVGESEAYIRTVIAIPSGGWTLEEFMDGNSWLHWDTDYDDKIGDNRPSFLTNGNCDANGWMWSEDGKEAWPTSISNLDVVTGTDGTGVEIDGVKYFIFTVTNKDALAPSRRTAPNLLGFYMDSKVDNDTVSGVKNWFYRNGSTTKPIDTFTNEDGKVQVMVVSQATQTLGFDDAWDALDTAFGEITEYNHPWQTNISDPAAKTKATALANQLNGLKELSGAQTIMLESGATYDFSEIDWKSLYLTNSVDITIEGNNATITGLKAPLFGEALVNITIKDLTISGANMVNTSTNNNNMTCAYGAFIQYTTNKNITLSNCHLKNSKITSTQKARDGKPYNFGECVSGDWVGGMVGYFSEGTAKFENCTVVNCTIKGNESVGGIIGNAGGGNAATNLVTFNNCSVSGNSKLHSNKNGSYRIGAIVGSINSTATMTTCSESGTTLNQANPTDKPADVTGNRALYGRISNGSLKIDGNAV